jgi:AraC-like DNA-binding protein
MYSKITSGFGLSYGPLLMAATMAHLKKPMKRPQIFTHLIPFMVFSVIYILFIAGMWQHTLPIQFVELYNHYYQFLVVSSLFLYPLAIKYILHRHQQTNRQPEVWLLNHVADVFILGVFVGILFFVTGIYRVKLPAFDLRIIPYICFTSIPVFFLRYKFLQKADFSVTHTLLPATTIALPPHATGEEQEKRYQKSGLDDTMLSEYETRLTGFMTSNKVYLDTELSLEILSQKVNIPKHHITQLLNDRLHKSFYRFINEYRIQDAIEKLKDQTAEVNILSLAYDCGFNSKSSFNNYFKQFTGYTPSAYRKLHETPLSTKA